MLRPLASDDVAQGRRGRDRSRRLTTTEVRAAAEAAAGSVGRALRFLEGNALELRQQVTGLLDRLPQLDPREVHRIGDAIAGTDMERLSAFMDTVNDWLSARLAQATQDGAEGTRVARIAEAWEKVNNAARDAEAFNLDRKPFVFSVFGQLAEAARA